MPNPWRVESFDLSTDLLPVNTGSADRGGVHLSRRSLLGIGLGTALTAAVPGVLSRPLRASGGVSAALGDVALAANERRAASSLAPRVVSRAAWGAHEGLRRGPAGFDSLVRSVVVHHTANTSQGRTPAQQVRAIYEEQLTRGYGDVAYHWLITEDGTVFEGRWAQDYPVGQLHDGEDRHGNNVRGGATKHHNTETIAIALVGDFTTRRPSSAALASLVDVITWKCSRWELSPLGVSPYITSAGTFRHLPALVGHRDCRVTECPGNALYAMLPQLRTQVAARLADGGRARHWLVGADGLLAYGTLDDAPSEDPVAGVVPQPGARGLWAWSSVGGVFALGGAPFLGSLGARHGADGPITGFAPTPSGQGYWLVTANGGVFAFGDATFFGSRGGKKLAAPVIDIVVTRTGRGYWLFSTDGGVFAYGDASYRGGATQLELRAPIVAAARTATGRGYWLAGRDGGVFAFGDARHHGAAAPGAVTSPLVGIVPDEAGRGYGLLLADGGVLSFGRFSAAHRHEGSLLDAVGGAIG